MKCTYFCAKLVALPQYGKRFLDQKYSVLTGSLTGGKVDAAESQREMCDMPPAISVICHLHNNYTQYRRQHIKNWHYI